MAKGVSISVVLALTLSAAQPGLGQIIPDKTLGQESSILTPNVNVKGDLSNRIDGGAIRQSSLFHSFSEFNVGEFERVYFANPAGIESIFSRVTGTDGSDIMGTLGVDGPADLFLLNPHGIVFGENASLDIAGSFLATTAEAFTLTNGQLFSAVTPDVPALLSVSLKPGLQWQGTEIASINSQGQLVVGQDLTLAGGDLNLQGTLQSGADLRLQGLGTVTIRDDAAEPFIASSAGDLSVQGHQGVDIFALNHPNSGLFSQGDLILQSGGTVIGDAHFSTGGNFRIEQLDGAALGWSSIVDPIIRSAGDVTFDDYTGASLHILAGGSVTAGDIEITGADTLGNSLQEQVTLSDGITVVEIDGNAEPTLDIRAGTLTVNSVGVAGEIAGFGVGEPESDVTATTADISVGNITNPGGQVFLSNQYQPNLSLVGGEIQTGSIDTSIERLTAGVARGGDVVVDARGSVDITGDITTIASAGIIEELIEIEEFFGEEFVNVTEVIVFAGDDAQALAGNITIVSGNNITATNFDTSAFAAAQAEQTQTFLEDGTEQVEAGIARAIASGGDINLKSLVNTPDQAVTASVGNIDIVNINSSARTNADASVDASINNDEESNAGVALGGTVTPQTRAGDVFFSTQVTTGDIVTESMVGTIHTLEINTDARTTAQSTAVADVSVDPFIIASNSGTIPPPRVEIFDGFIFEELIVPFAFDVNNQGNGGIATGGTVQGIENYGGGITLSTQVSTGDVIAGTDIGSISTNRLNTNTDVSTSVGSSASTEISSDTFAEFTLATIENSGDGGLSTGGTVQNIQNRGGEIVLQTQVNTANVLAESRIGDIDTTDISTDAYAFNSSSASAGARNFDGSNSGNGGVAGGGVVQALQNNGGGITLKTTVTTEAIGAESDIGNLSMSNYTTTARAFGSVSASTDTRLFDGFNDNSGNGGTSTGGVFQDFENWGGDIDLRTEITTGPITADSYIGNLSTVDLNSSADIGAVAGSGANVNTNYLVGARNNSGNGGTAIAGTIRDFQSIAGEITLDTAVNIGGATTESKVGNLTTSSLRAAANIWPDTRATAYAFGSEENSGNGGIAIGGTIQNLEGRGGTILLNTQLLHTDSMTTVSDRGSLQVTNDIDTSGNITVDIGTDVRADVESRSERSQNSGINGQVINTVINSISTQGGQVATNTQDIIQIGNISTSSNIAEISASSNPAERRLDPVRVSLDIQGETFNNAGDIRLSSTFGEIELRQDTSIQANVSGGDGDGGNIDLSGASLRLVGNTLTTTVDSQGRAGDITLNAKDIANVSGSRLLSGREFDATGTGVGGTIDVSAGTINLNDFTLLNTSTTGTGGAGPIRLGTTSGDITLNNSSLFSLTAGAGDAGDIDVQSTDALKLNGNSVISTAVVLGSQGNGGNIYVAAPSGIFIQGTGQPPIELQSLGTQSNIINAVEPNSGFKFDETGSIVFNEAGIEVRDLTTAQSIESSFSVTSDPNVVFSTEVPHVTILGTRPSDIIPFSSAYDIYSFSVASPGTQVIFDVDNVQTDEASAGVPDLRLYLYDESSNRIAFNDSAEITLGGSGSTDSSEPFLSYIFNKPGNYFIEVAGAGDARLSGRFNSDISVRIRNSGSYTLNISRVDASLVNSGITTQTRTSGTAGDITINAPIIDIQNSGQISTETLRDGQAGNITLNPIASSPDLTINLTGENSQITTSTLESSLGTTNIDNGNSGDITITAPNSVTIQGDNNGRIALETDSAGNGGDLRIDTGILTIQDGITVSARSNPDSSGTAGNIEVNATDSVTIRDASTLSVETQGSDIAGNITINTPLLTVDSDAAITATATATAAPTSQGGNIDLNASTMAIAGELGVLSETQGLAPAGILTLSPYQDDPNLDIQLRNTARISASTEASGDGGDLIISAPDTISIQGDGRIAVETQGSGDAGTLRISSRDLTIDDQALLTAESSGGGDAGGIDINLTGQLTLQGGTAISVSSEGEATAGDLQITANQVAVREGSILSAQTESGSGANIALTVDDHLSLNNSEIAASTVDGIGGNITVNNLNTLDLQQGKISAETQTGRAGNIKIEASDQVHLQNASELSVETNTISTATIDSFIPIAGDLSIATDLLDVESGSRILVQSLNGQAGNIDIEADRVRLNNGEISAVTAQTPEADIDSATIDINDLQLLFLKNDSLISARALTGADGGNINIAGDNAFIIALPLNNSDIIATADDGAGGEITISVSQLFGLTQQDTSIGLENNRTNDLSASSATGPQGIVTLNTLNIDPTQGLLELPEGFADSFSFDAVCNAAAQGGNTFMSTGRGGLPAAPTTLPDNIDPWEDWFMVNAEAPLSASTASTVELSDEQLSPRNSNNVEQVTEAQGWLVTNDGITMLVVDSDNALISTNGALKPLVCGGLKDEYLN